MDLLKTEKLKKWFSARRGRMLLMANMLKMRKSKLYNLIVNNRLSDDLYLVMIRKQKVIEDIEKRCIKKLYYLKQFALKDSKLIPRLAEKLNIHTNKIYRLVRATGDSRYLLINYDVKKVMLAIHEVKKEHN